MTIKVLVVDDHDLVRVAISRMLADEHGIEVVGVASCGEEGLSKARSMAPDVILMDMKMPGIGGMEATKKVMLQCPDCKVIALSGVDDVDFVQRLLSAGAMGYLTKNAEVGEIVKAINMVASGKGYLPQDIAQQIALRRLNPNQDSPFNELSERELQIAIMVVNGEKAQDISDKLCLSPKTVNSYRYRIFEKLKITGDVELTRMAIRHGLIDMLDI